jgi:hypothetical protein
VLAAIWAEVLKLERVGRQDNFFELGGHSLLAVQVMTRVQQVMGLELMIDDIFDRPALAQLAEHLMYIQLELFDSKELTRLLKIVRHS